MPRTKIVPCLVVDESGAINIVLHRGPVASFQYPDWRCQIKNCRMVKERETGVDPEMMRVNLGDRGPIHGVVGCEGAGNFRRGWMLK